MRSRGITIIETVFSVAILALIIILVGDAVAHTLQTGSMNVGRAGEMRNAASLEARLNEEARSATSVFIPPLDLLGQPNSSSSAHEVDFYRKASRGRDAFVAYRFDRGSGTVTRYDYLLAGKTPQPSDADLTAEGVSAFFPQSIPVGASGDVVNGQSIMPVAIYYGSQQYPGGNGVVELGITTAASLGAPAESQTIHLAAKSAPTDLAELVTGSPPPPKGPKVVRFLIIPKLSKGPWHGGGGGDGNPGQIHNIALPGTAEFLGGDSGPVNWFEVSSMEPIIESGLYRFKDSNGNNIQLTVSCVDAPCPQFVPQPQNIPDAPPGVVVFRTSQ